MRFIVKRSSIESGKPCDEAIPGKEELWCIIDLSDEEFNQLYSGFPGKRHRRVVETNRVNKDGKIEWNTGYEECWVLNIDNLEQLMEFIKKYGNVVIFEKDHDDDDNEIEIYDDYRE